MNVYLVEDCLKDKEEIESWINLANEQLKDPNSPLSRWCGRKELQFNIKNFNFHYIKGTDTKNSTKRNQYYCEEDVSTILSILSENNEDKLLLLDIMLTERQQHSELADEILNKLYRQPGSNVKVLLTTSVSNIYDKLDELFTCDPLPEYIYKSMLSPEYFSQHFLRSFVFFSQKGYAPNPEEILSWNNFDAEGA